MPTAGDVTKRMNMEHRFLLSNGALLPVFLRAGLELEHFGDEI